MKDYELTYIIGRVRNILDQNMDTDSMSGFGDAETLELDEVITEQICAGAQMVELAAPHEMLGNGVDFRSSIGKIQVASDGMYFIPLPKDFLRIVYFRMNDWNVGIEDFHRIGSAEYYRNHSRYRSVSSSPYRPIAVLLPRDTGDGKMAVEVRSTGLVADGKLAVNNGMYIPKPTITENGVKLCSKLEDPIMYAIASLVANSFGAVQQSVNLMSTARALAGITNQQPQQQPQQSEEQ